MLDVSIIIVNYKTMSVLTDMIDSVLKHSIDISFEIIVVDNNSNDGSEQFIQKLYGNSVIYLALSDNVGFGRANNEGAKIAIGKYLFLLNPDTLLLNNAMKILSDYLDTHSDVAITGGNLFSLDMKPNASFGRKLLFPSWFMEISNLSAWVLPRLIYGKNFEFNHTIKPLEVGFIIGADMMIRSDVFHMVHGFDPAFFMYAEETDLSYRIRRIGYKSISVPDAKIIHLEGKSCQYKETQMRMRYDSRVIYYSKHYGKFYFCIANLLHYLTLLSRIVGYSLVANNKKHEWISNFKIFTKSLTY